MKIAIVGTGYQGLVVGTCLAESGHQVVCVEQDEARADSLQAGEVPFHEPGLEELLIGLHQHFGVHPQVFKPGLGQQRADRVGQAARFIRSLVHQPPRPSLGDQFPVEPGPQPPLADPRGRIGQRGRHPAAAAVPAI